MYLTHKYASKEIRHKICFLGLGIVGLGSTAFHGSLRYSAQLLDELPMLIGMLCNFYCLLELLIDNKLKQKINENATGNKYKHKNKNKNNIIPTTKVHYKLAIILTIIAIFEIVCYVYFKFYVIFVASYILLAAVITIVTIKLVKTPVARKVYFACLAIYWGGIVVWNIEFHFCRRVQTLQLHALWHLCGGYGSYFYILLCVVLRGEYYNKKAKLAIKHGVGHYIVIKMDD